LFVKIGVVLFAIGVFLLLPFDEIFILLPLILFYGIGIIPIYYAIAFFCFIGGAVLVGIHIIPWLLKNPIGVMMLLFALMVALYLWVL